VALRILFFIMHELVSDRFKIVRMLGQGGMGAVYEAEDLELGGHVALKTVRPETATNPARIERFKQEIYLARKVTHPNICRIFDLFHHRVGSADGEIMFVTMELLRGETLADRLRRVGRMSAPSSCRSSRRWPRDSRPHTRPASSIAISSRATSSSFR
jgi:serine/threonine protein kinase